VEPNVLAIVPVYNGRFFAVKAIKSLLSQNYSNLRIVVIDDCSEDDSSSLILKEFSDFPQITILRNERNVGLAQTLNKALELVTNEEFLLVLEQDCELLNSDYVSEALKHFQRDDVAVVSGENLPTNEELSLMKKVFLHHLCEDVHDVGVVEVGFSLLKADVFRVEVLRKVGGFESSTRRKLASEEHVVSHKIRSLGYRILKDPSLKFRGYWGGQESLLQNLRKEAVYGRGLGWAVARMRTDLKVGESKQLKSKRRSRMVQTVYVLLTVFSLFLFFYNPLIALVLLSAAALVEFGYLCYRALVFRGVKERLFFVVTGFLRGWVYVPNLFFGFLCGLVFGWRGKVASSSKAS